MIQESYVSFETANLLKEKGFDESTSMVYMPYGDLCKLNRYDSIHNSNYNDITKNYFECTAPTHQMTMRWLREVHNIFIEISTSIDLNGNYHFRYTILDKECKYVRRGYTEFDWNYEEAVEAALKYCLENLI